MWFPENRTLSFNDVDRLCQELFKKIQNKNIDSVISIEQGGWYVGKHIAGNLDVTHDQINIQRSIARSVGRKKCDVYRWLPTCLHIVPAICQGVVRLVSPVRLMSGVIYTESIVNKNVLLVDDATHTGKTFQVAREYIDYYSPASLQVAALASVKGSQPSVDYHLLEGHYCYPWSKVSIEYKKFLQLHSIGHASHGVASS